MLSDTTSVCFLIHILSIFLSPGVCQTQSFQPPTTISPILTTQPMSCVPGYSAYGTTGCEVCDTGLYKANSGTGPCISCGPNYHAAVGKGASTCIPCSGVECKCASGYGLYANDETFQCQTCAMGSYNNRYDSLGCVLCPPGFSQASEGQTECVECKDQLTSVRGAPNCFAHCTAGSYLTGVGCTSCPPNSKSGAQSVDVTACICNTGYAMSDSSAQSRDIWCDICSAGFFLENTVNGNKCIECTAGNTSVPGSSECFGKCHTGYRLTTTGCAPCRPSSSYTLPANAPVVGGECVCDKGYTGGQEGFECVPCLTGTYKDTSGTGECVPCPGFNYSPVASTDAAMNCSCKKGTSSITEGLLKHATTCTDCPAGKYKSTNEHVDCTPCGIGFISHTGATNCTMCSPGEGTVMTYTQCVRVNSSIGCMSGTGVATSRTSCRICTSKESIDNKTATCICNSGHYRPPLTHTNSNECELCPEDTFKPARGDEQCTPCGSNSHRGNYTNQTHCICNPGAFEDVGGGCTLCAIGTYKETDGPHACTTCMLKHSTRDAGSTAAAACKCAAGSFNTDVDSCEKCPAKTYNPIVADGDISQCQMCPYKRFQPVAGQTDCLPMFVSLTGAFETNSRVVGIFVEGATSCVYVSRESTQTTDKECWGEKTVKNPPFTSIMAAIPYLCGDGILHPITEQCDDGNFEDGDGCNSLCEVEKDFFCERPVTSNNLTQSLLQPSVCCRKSSNPPEHTPSCARCDNRKPPYDGVRWNSKTCALIDINECDSGFDGCVLKDGGFMCENLDGRLQTPGFQCVCPPGEFLADGETDQICIAERFSIRFVLEDIGINIDRLQENIRDEAHRATSVAVLAAVRFDVVEEKMIQCTIFVGSWAKMQHLTEKFNVSRLIEQMQSGAGTNNATAYIEV